MKPVGVLAVVPEIFPLIKTGGLADVVGALPDALAGLGHQVAVVLPRYATTDLKSARRVYDRLGFVDGYAYHYRTPPDGAS